MGNYHLTGNIIVLNMVKYSLTILSFVQTKIETSTERRGVHFNSPF